ncbi:MAG: FHA domain-containing protein [Planctomycetota bacterium]
MAQFVLEILDGDRAGDVVSLGSEPLKIGRKPGNDLVVADEKASGVHAEVAFEGDRYVLRDLGSTNGTLMDGRKITEVVLGSGDTFAIGRVRLRFRADGEDAAPTGDGFAVDRIDASRLQAARKGSRSAGLMAAVLVVVVGAGGYLWWSSNAAADGGGGNRSGTAQQAELRVPGNKLQQETGSCETEAGWDLRVAGAGFATGGVGHTGRGGLESVRAGDGPDFAVMATTEEQRVLPGRTLQVQAWLRTDGGGRGAVRAAFWSSNEQKPFRYRIGTALRASAEWELHEAAVAVPDGVDRCRVEVVAVLPGEGSAVACDDVALLEAGQAAAIARKVGETATLLGSGASIAIQSNNPDQPATLLGLVPGGAAVTADLRGLHAAGELMLSDLGASVAVDGDERQARVTVTGCSALELQFPKDSAGGLLVAGEDGFAGAESNSAFRTDKVLLGDASTRCLIELDAPAELGGHTAGGVYHLQVPATALRFVLGFRAERQQARELLRAAEEQAQAGEPGRALDTVRELLRTVPHDAETLANALARRAEWQEQLAQRLRQLDADLDEAEFFQTRGGFERVVAELDRLRALFGDANLEDPQRLQAMRDRAAQQLAALDAAQQQQQQQRLEALAEALEKARQTDLAALVRGNQGGR